MSWVANVMILVDMTDNENVEALSEWLRTEAPRRSGHEGRGVGYLNPLTDVGSARWGGWKAPECDVWAGALNHADLEALRQQFIETPWREPNTAQLFVMDQEEAYFRLWMIRGGELRQFAPLVPDEEDEDFYQGW